MLIETVVIGLVVALLRGVRLQDFRKLTFKGFGLVVTVALMRVLMPFAPSLSNFFFPTSLFFLALFALMNRHLSGMKLSLAGILCNLLASLVAGGRMPVDDWATSRVNSGSAQFITHVSSGGSLVETLLGDSLLIGPPYPWPVALSLGDLLLSVGMIVLVLSLGRTNRVDNA